MSGKIIKSSIWLEFEKPFGEPDIFYNGSVYCIERIEKPDDIVWYGLGTNWVKQKDKGWKKLEGINFVPCEEPIYETFYQSLK